MIGLALSVVAGLVFGAGLVIGGMTMPAHVLGFLDPLGGWDPQLAFVMAGGLTTYAVLSRVVRARRTQPWCDTTFHLPTRRDLDLPLIAGAALFGIGWGLGGFCPGPAIVSAGGGSPGALIVVAAMLVGMRLGRRAG